MVYSTFTYELNIHKVKTWKQKIQSYGIKHTEEMQTETVL